MLMMKNLLGLIFILFGFSVVGQISYTPSPLSMMVSQSSGDNKLDIFFTVSKDTTYSIYWKLDKDPNTFHSNWVSYVCDLNNCYFNNIDKSSPNAPNMLNKGTHKFEFHFKPEGIPGNAMVGLKLYTDKNFTNEILSTNISINSSGSSSLKEVLNSYIKIYPNPTSDFFQLVNNTSVKKVIVYNMFGKEIKSFFHYNNAQHDISELKSGMYIIKMVDDKNKVIRTLKLNKSYDGA